MFDNLYADFICLMDGIFYEGYTEQFAAEFPKEFTEEYNQFCENYSKA